MKFLRCVVVLLLFLGFVPRACPQDQPPAKKEDPRRFWSVKSWTGTFTVTRQGTGARTNSKNKGAHYHGSVNWSVNGAFHLADRQEKDRFQLQPVHWTGAGEGHVSIDFYQISGDYRSWYNDVTRGSGAGTLRQAKLPKFPPVPANWGEDRPLGPELSIQRVSASEGYYGLTLGLIVLDVQERATMLTFNPDRRVVDSVSRPAMFIIHLDRLSLPQEGLVLKGSKTMPSVSFEANVCNLFRDASPNGMRAYAGSHVLAEPNDDPKCVITWELTPAAEDVRLVIEPEDQKKYDTWVPQAGKDEKTPGNDVAFVAKLETIQGKPTTIKARKIRFELVDVSREPGIAINYPVRTKATDDFDLRFHQDRNKGNLNVIGADGQVAETPSKEAGVDQARVVVTANDYGAYGLLRAIAEMPDGTRAIGYLKGQPNRHAVLLPKRKDDSRIAEIERKKFNTPNLSDDDDSESDPLGDGFKGDGLTLYEEYRGFFVNGVHKRGDYAKKDLFVWDKVRNDHAEPGILHFERMAGIIVHRIKNDDEVMIDYVINANFSPRTPRRTNQHAVKFGEAGVKAIKSEANIIETIPGSPKSVRLILLAPIFKPGSEAFKLMTTHELGHALNIPHHGHADLGWVTWKTGKDKAGKPILTETIIGHDETAKPKAKSQTITVKNEDGTPFVPDNSFDDGRKIWVAKEHGQHSGDASCFMRYIVAHAYVPAGQNSLRHWISTQEVRGSKLCEAKTGTDPAARRYGDAHMGDCLHRFRISDAP